MKPIVIFIIISIITGVRIASIEESSEKIQYFNGHREISLEEFQKNGENGKTISFYHNGKKKEEIYWQDGKKNKIRTQWYKNGKKRRQSQLNSGLYDGEDIRWFSNGHLRSKESYKNGQKNGKWINCFENGVKQYEGAYRDDLRHGKWTYWNINGEKTGQGEFKTGTGSLEFQYRNGKIKKHEEHFKGKAHGTWIEWFPNGNKKFEIQYHMGKLHGTFIRWYENGQKMRETHFKNGIFHGNDTYWYDNGKINFQREYKEGKRHNKWLSWFQDGKRKGIGQYTEGTGSWREFFKTGKKKSESYQFDGKPDGKQYEWYENGNKKSLHTWRKGKRHGKWIWWDPNGTVAREQEWMENQIKKQMEPPPADNDKSQSSSAEPSELPGKVKDNKPLANDIKKIVQLQTNLKRDVSVIVGINEKGKRWIFPFGKKSFSDPVIPDQNTVYEIGSISKTFTAILLADMYQKGYLDINDPVQKYLPVNAVLPKFNEDEITFYHLATHSSSLPNMDNNLPHHILDPGDPFASYTCYDMYNFFSRITLKKPLGSSGEYSNFGVGLLGHVLGIINGTTYEKLLKDKLLNVLKMDNTSLFLTDKQKKNLAPGHKIDGTETPNWNFTDCLQGAGGIKSTLLDMFKYMEANLGLTDSPLHEAMVLTHEPQVETPWKDYNSLGWGVEKINDQDMVWHNGGTEGYHTFLGFIPKLELGVIILSNYRGTNMDAIGRQVLRLFLSNR